MVTILLITQDNYWLTRYVIQNLLKNSTEVEKQLFIIDNNSSDKRIKEYGKSVAQLHIQQNETLPNSLCYNELLKAEAITDYYCVFPNSIMVNDFWLSDMVREIEYVDKAGISAIHTHGEKGFLNPYLTNDDSMYHVWCTPDGDLTGVFLFPPIIISGVGGFDKSLSGYGLEQRQFSLRVKRDGR